MWLDGPFFQLVERFSSMSTYWYKQAMAVGKLVIVINLLFCTIKWAFGDSSFHKDLLKMFFSLCLTLFLVSNYSSIMAGLRGLVYQWGYNSTYTQGVEDSITKLRTDTEWWNKMASVRDEFTTGANEHAENTHDVAVQERGRYSDIIKEVSVYYGSGQVGTRYVLDIYDEDTQFIRPNAIARFTLLICEQMYRKICSMGIQQFGQMLCIFFCMAAVLFCSLMALMQYVICCLEFMLITAIGIVMIPFMMWDASKFVTEKLIGCILGFTVKLLILTMAIMLCCTGYIELMTRPFEGSLDQIFYTIFVSLFYMMLCQNGPQIAMSILTGSPQMSLGEGLQAVAAYAAGGAAIGGAAKAGGSALAKSGVGLAGAHAQAMGAAEKSKNDGGSSINGYAQSIASSAGNTVKSAGHSLAGSLVGRKGGGGAGSSGGTNRFSRLEQYKSPNENGESKTVKEYLKERKQEGQNGSKAEIIAQPKNTGTMASSTSDDSKTPKSPTESKQSSNSAVNWMMSKNEDEKGNV